MRQRVHEVQCPVCRTIHREERGHICQKCRRALAVERMRKLRDGGIWKKNWPLPLVYDGGETRP